MKKTEQEIRPELIGTKCSCRAGKIGIVKGIKLLHDGTVIYYGHAVGNMAQPWQSKHPIPIDL